MDAKDVKVTYEMAKPEDYDEIIDLANFVFSYAHRPHEFKTLIPKAYGPDRTMWPEHFLARENGRIRGMVGLLPFNLRVLDETLKVGFIGTVSVHQYSRGMGHMKKCMAMSTQYAREHDIDFNMLGGQRQRYEYYGYEPAAVSYSFDITRTNCRHALSAVDTSGVSFKPFSEVRSRMNEIHDIYEQGPVAGARPVENFEQICTSWNCRPYAVLCGEYIIGYVITSKNPASIEELRLKDSADFDVVVKAYLEQFNQEGVSIRIPPHRADDVRAAELICEGMDVSPSEMMMIFNYERVVKTYLRLKQQIEGKLPDGRVALGITGLDGCEQPRTLLITVENGEIDCRFTDDTPDIVLSTLAAQNLMLTPVSYVDMSQLPDCARRYFPLPIYMEHSDCF